MINFKYLIVFGFFLPLAACKSQNIGSTPNSFITEDQLGTAMKVIGKIDYLPFRFDKDGCYARSLFMAMELASVEVPSSSQFAFAPQNGSLRLPNGTQWGYHVAPMVTVLQEPGKPPADPDVLREPFILDPALDSLKPMYRSEWVAMMGNQASLRAVPGSIADSEEVKKRNQDEVISRLSDMPPFDLNMIDSYCGVLKSYLNKVGDDSYTVNKKQQKLMTRTAEMVVQLRDLGLIRTAGTVECREYNPLEENSGIY